MDKNKAENLFKELNNKQIDNITIKKLINHGKSAAVFQGIKNKKFYAVKIFDNELIHNYGVEIQQKRIELELSLKNHNINNLIKIINGGNINIDSNDFYYLIMEYIDGVNLKQYIEQKEINLEFIINVIKILISTTEQLLKNDPPLAHRDIKPENVMISNTGEVILMDLGVLFIIGNPSMSDVGQKQFLGTLRYAPPEFLTRKEENSIEGWRAINIYQIGAVLHDLITGKELFYSIEPYANLVITIKEDMPKIINDDYHPDLVQLARNMLQKDWKKRLVQCTIDEIDKILNICLLPEEEPINIFNKIKSSTTSIRDDLDEISKIKRSLEEKDKVKNEINSNILKLIHECFTNISSNETIDSINNSKVFTLRDWNNKEFKVSNIFYQVNGKYEFGFAKPVYILFKVDNNENSLCRVHVIGIIIDSFKKPNLQKPEDMIFDVFDTGLIRTNRRVKPQSININFNCIFDGIVEINDINFRNIILNTIAKILHKAVEIMKPDIENELKRRKSMIGAGPGVYSSISTTKGNIYINDF